MKYFQSLALAFGLAAAPSVCSEAKERQPSVDISRLESLSGEIVKVESRHVDSYHVFGDIESRTITRESPDTYTLITVQQRYAGLMELPEVVRTVAISPRRDDGLGAMTSKMPIPLTVGTLVGVKYYPSKNGKVHERDIASILFDALGTRASAQEIKADGIVHPLY
ncbi:MAG: hypothetical protein Q7K45_05300 [Nanoarchaeota archaeon]|nr:hypothetical protein [Nanoarchaeota archaeon]